MRWLFVSDLHGRRPRYAQLFRAIERQRPAVVLLGGDLLPHAGGMAQYPGARDFITDVLAVRFRALKERMGEEYPDILLILGNDDRRRTAMAFDDAAHAPLWTSLHQKRRRLDGYTVYGYQCVPPTPFQHKDWERYDVTRTVTPGCLRPEDGRFTDERSREEAATATIADDLRRLTADDDLRDAVLLFHSPPYGTGLDRAALDGKSVDGVPLDPHVGSVAIRTLIDDRSPRITLHGHVHESASRTGRWKEQLGETWCFSAAHDGPELALVLFDPAAPGEAERMLL